MLPSLFISHGSPMLALQPGASGPALARLAAELAGVREAELVALRRAVHLDRVEAVVLARDGHLARVRRPRPGQGCGELMKKAIDVQAAVVIAAMQRPTRDGLYLPADDEPAPPQDVLAFAAQLGGFTLPPALAEAIRERTGKDALAFFDAIAPIVHTDSINMDICWYQ